MLKSSKKFVLESKDERDISFDLDKTNQNVICVFNITYRKCQFYCTSYCLCCMKRINKVIFLKKCYVKNFKVIFENLNTNRKQIIDIFSNFDIKILSLPTGEYKIKIVDGNKNLITIRLIFREPKSVVKLEIEF